MGSWCLSHFEIHARKSQRARGIGASFKPEFRSMISKGFWVMRQQVLVSHRRFVAPIVGLLHSIQLP